MPSQNYYPTLIPPHTYGYSRYWIEEFWAFTKFLQLKHNFPKFSFDGLIDESFISEMRSHFLGYPYNQLQGINTFLGLNDSFYIYNRKFINLATSHAPSRYIAESNLIKYKKNFAVISFDAHFDFENRTIINNVWITEKLASSVILIGGWAETNSDLIHVSNIFPFIFQNPDELLTTPKFISWIRGKQIYVTIDLDFFPLSQHDYLGYSNYWHREYLIGHANTFEQQLSKVLMDTSRLNQSKDKPNQYLVGKILDFFPDLKKFQENKLRSLEKQSLDLLYLFKTLKRIIKESSANLICIDLVEYSPICDWNQLSLKELIMLYPHLISIFKGRGK